MEYPNQGHQQCYQIEDKSFWFRHRNKVIYEIVNRYHNKGIFYDIGGGNGYVAKYLQDNNINVTMVEPGKDGPPNARDRGVKNVLNKKIEDIQHKDCSQSIGLFDVFEHINDRPTFLENCHRLLCDNGILFLTLPTYNFLWSQEDIDAEHKLRYTLKSISKELNNSNFKPLYGSYFFFFLPILIFLFRTLPYKLKLTSRKSYTDKKNATEHGIGLIGKLFLIILNLELYIMKYIPIPFGSSCIIVAKKS